MIRRKCRAWIAELKARIAKTAKFVQGFSAKDIDGSEGRDITLTIGGQQMHFKGEPYLVHLAVPNFYFHATTAYAIPAAGSRSANVISWERFDARRPPLDGSF